MWIDAPRRHSKPSDTEPSDTPSIYVPSGEVGMKESGFDRVGGSRRASDQGVIRAPAERNFQIAVESWSWHSRSVVTARS